MGYSSLLLSRRVLLNGEFVRFIIRKRRLSQKCIAARLRISEGQFTQYLNGSFRVAPRKVLALSRILKVTDPSLLVFEGLVGGS